MGVGVPPNHFYLCRAVVVYLVLIVVSIKVGIVCAEYSAASARDSKRHVGGRGTVGVGLPVNILARICGGAIVHPMSQVLRHTGLDALGVAAKGEHHGYT